MARMTRRITNKINKTKETQQPKKNEKKYGKDIWLIALIIVNFVLLAISWQTLLLAPTNLAIYVILEIVMIVMYVNRHAKLSEEVSKWLDRIQYFFMAIILVLFIYNCVIYFTN